MSRSPGKSSLGAALLPSLGVLALALGGTAFGSYQQYTICLALLAGVVGAALNMIVGYARIIMLAAGAMSAVGAYGATLLLLHLHAPLLVALGAAALLGGCAGLILAVPATRFRGHHLAMVTLVFQMVAMIAIREGGDLTGGSAGLKVPAVDFFGLPLHDDAAYLIFTGCASSVAVLIIAILLHGHFGRVLRATSMSEVGVAGFGVRVRDYHIAAFTISSATIAFAGALLAPRIRILDPESFGFLSSVMALAYPIVGGLTSIWGGLIGGALLRLFPEWLRFLQEWRDVIYAALVIATMRFLPGGLVDSLRDALAGIRTRRGAKEAAPLPAAPARAASAAQASPKLDPDVALRVSGLTKSFGALRAVDDVTMQVRAGTIHGLIGPNGAGKTTFFNMVSGFIPVDAGDVRIFGHDVTSADASARVAFGMTRTFQTIATFGRLTCLDNVMIGLGRNRVRDALATSLYELVGSTTARRNRARALDALEAVGIGHLAATPAALLSLGNQRRLEIARAIASNPRLILFDEPVSGVSADEEYRIEALLLRLNAEMSVTMLIIEHDIGFIRRLSEEVTVMVHGAILATGSPREALADARVRTAYFGEDVVAN